VENEGMRITIVGAVLIIAAFVGAVLTIRYLIRKAEEPKPLQG
jgi:hypothetical protein